MNMDKLIEYDLNTPTDCDLEDQFGWSETKIVLYVDLLV